jgi:hypothetical protein
MSAIDNIIKRVKQGSSGTTASRLLSSNKAIKKIEDDDDSNYKTIIDKPSSTYTITPYKSVPSTYTNDFEKVYQVIKSSYNCGVKPNYIYEACYYDSLVQNYIQKGVADVSSLSGYSNVSLQDLPLACNISSVVYNNCSPPTNMLTTTTEVTQTTGGFRLNFRGLYLYPNINNTELIIKKANEPDFEINKATFIIKNNYYYLNVSTGLYISPKISKPYIITNQIMFIPDKYYIQIPHTVEIYDEYDLIKYSFNVSVKIDGKVTYYNTQFTMNKVTDKKVYEFTSNYNISFPTNLELFIDYNTNNVNNYSINFQNNEKISKIIINNDKINIYDALLINNNRYYTNTNGLNKFLFTSSNLIDKKILLTQEMTDENKAEFLNFDKFSYYLYYKTRILQFKNYAILYDVNSYSLTLTTTLYNGSIFYLENVIEPLNIYGSVSPIKTFDNSSYDSIFSKDNSKIILFMKNSNIFYLSTNGGYNFSQYSFPNNISKVLLSDYGNLIVSYRFDTIFLCLTSNPTSFSSFFITNDSIKYVCMSFTANLIYIFTSNISLMCIVDTRKINLIRNLNSYVSDISTFQTNNIGNKLILTQLNKIFISEDYGMNFSIIDLCSKYKFFNLIASTSIFSIDDCNFGLNQVRTINAKFINSVLYLKVYPGFFYYKKSKIDIDKNDFDNKFSNTFSKYVFYVEKYIDKITVNIIFLKDNRTMQISDIPYNDNINFNINLEGSFILIVSGNILYKINTNLPNNLLDNNIYLNYGLTYPSYYFNTSITSNQGVKQIIDANNYLLYSNSIILKTIRNSNFILSITSYSILKNNTSIYTNSGSIRDIACSNNGQYILAAVYNGKLLVSSDSGTSFTEYNEAGKLTGSTISASITNITRYWISVACSFSGKYMSACAYNGNIFISTNNGVLFTSSPQNYSKKWIQIVMSKSSDDTKDGIIQLACAEDGLFISYDRGSNWSQISNEVIDNALSNTGSVTSKWSSVAISESGQYMLATVYGGNVYASYNYGYDWSIYGVSRKECYEPVVYPNNTTSDYLGYSVIASSTLSGTNIINVFIDDTSIWSPTTVNSSVIIKLPYQFLITDINIVNITSQDVKILVEGTNSNDESNWIPLGNNLNLYSTVDNIGVSYYRYRLTFSSSNIQIQRIKLLGKTDFVSAGAMSQIGNWSSCAIVSETIHYASIDSGSNVGLYQSVVSSSFGKFINIVSNTDLSVNIYDKNNNIVTVDPMKVSYSNLNKVKRIELTNDTDIGRIEFPNVIPRSLFIVNKNNVIYNSGLLNNLSNNLYPPISSNKLLSLQLKNWSHLLIYEYSSGVDAVIDNNFDNLYNPFPGEISPMWIYFDILGSSISSLVYVNRFKIKFYIAPENVSNTVSIYSDVGNITDYINNVKTATLLPDKKIFEKKFTGVYRTPPPAPDPNIITFETDIIPPVPVYQLLVNFSRTTFIYEIQFFSV